MASFIATNTNTADSDGFVFPAAGDDLTVPLDIHILATGAGFVGVTGPGGAIVQNNGRILGNAAGISLGGTGQTTTILNFADGTISSTSGAAIQVAATGVGGNVSIQNGGAVSATVGADGAIQVDGAGQVVNFGLVTSAGIGVVQMGSVASTNVFSLVNTATGVIVGDISGYCGQNSLVVEQIDNSGLINGGVVLGDGNGASMINQATGRLTGAALGSGGDVTFGDGDNDQFTNLGTMGALAMGNGAQAYVLNYGTMGGITLGDGDGAYVGNAGTIVGDVQLGDGDGQVFDSTSGLIYDSAHHAGTVTAGPGGATIVGALNGGHLVGGAGNDVLIANQTNLVGYAVVTTLDGKGGSNALYGGQGTNLFLSGNATYNQIWGAESAISGTHYSNNTVDYAAVTGAGRGIYVDLAHGHNAYIIDNGSYTFVDAIEHVPNVKGTAGDDIIQASGNPGIIEGRGGADQLYSGSGADTFVYTSYGDSNLVSGYDTISGFQTGVDKIDVSALGLTSVNALIESNATSTVLYFEMTPGTFNPATDLAISFTGANALALSDITFASSAPNGWSFFDYNNYYGTGYPDQSLMPTGAEPFAGNINIGLVLDRAHDPTELLEANWGTRQKMLAALGDHPLSYYGAKPEDYHDVVDALQSMGITLSTNPAYESSAESRTVWVSLTAAQFNTLFGQVLYEADSGGVYWNGNLALNSGVSSLGTVKGLAFDTDYGAVNLANIDLPDGVLPDGSTAQGVPLIQGPQGPGNATSGAPVSVYPQDVAKLYNFPLVNHPDAPTGKLGLIEPGMGSDTFTSTNIETLLDAYREAIGLTQQTGVTVIGQQQGGTQDTDSKERSLDLGVATAVNPNSTLVLYAGSGTADGAGSSAYSAYQSAFLDAGHASVVSSSFRFGSMQPGADSPFLWAARELMIDAALQNITVFQSSGDGGSSYGTGNGLTNTANARASEYSVIVGGTSLSTGSLASADPTLNGVNTAYTNYVGPALAGNPAVLWQLVAGGLSKMPTVDTADDWFLEAVWNRYNLNGDTLDPSYTANDSGNGGVDYTQPTPWYQSALLPFAPFVTNDAAHAPGRGVPDVSGLASGNMDYLVPQPDLTLPLRGDGGTSAATPLWASLALQINTIFKDQHLPDLGYMTDLLYIAAAVAPASFNDVTIGNNTSSFVSGGDISGLTPTGAGYSAALGYDLASGIGSPNGVLLARALTAIAQAQMNYDESVPDIANWHAGAWESGVLQTLLVQTTLPHAAGVVAVSGGGEILNYMSQASDDYAWTSRFAGQVEQRAFDADLVKLFDHQQQGTLGQLTIDAGDALSVAINGNQASGAAGLLTGDFGFIDFQTADGSSVRLARPVAVAETVVDPALGAADQPAGTTVVRVRQADTDSLAVRFYKVDDFTGSVGGARPGDANYAAAATAAAYTLTSGGSSSDPTSLLGPGHGLYAEATFAVHQGDIIAMQLTNVTTGNTYWAFSQANESANGQPVGHLWNYGLNTWGWEAGQAGGDHDFNDLTVQLDFTSAYGHGYLMS